MYWKWGGMDSSSWGNKWWLKFQEWMWRGQGSQNKQTERKTLSIFIEYPSLSFMPKGTNSSRQTTQCTETSLGYLTPADENEFETVPLGSMNLLLTKLIRDVFTMWHICSCNSYIMQHNPNHQEQLHRPSGKGAPWSTCHWQNVCLHWTIKRRE